MASFFLVSSIVRLVIRDKKKKIITSNRITSFFAIYVAKVLGLKVTSNYNSVGIPSDKNYLVISNHLSYTDIFVLSSFIPASFIASVDEVKETAVLGKATELSGSIFVERRSRSKIRNELNSISDTLEMGPNVVLFAEGTTSNGNNVLPFKTSFLAAAEEIDIDILPVCIKYKKINGETIDSNNRDSVFYYGNMTFFKHFFHLLNLKSVDVELTFLEIIKPGSYGSRKDLSELVHNSISTAYLT